MNDDAPGGNFALDSAQQLQQWVDRIEVTNQLEADVEVDNQSPLQMIGKGRQGAIFRITDDICMKVFGNNEDCDRENYALSLGSQTGLFPLVYDKGPNYIVMEYIKGVDLREYLQSQPLTPELSSKLIQMLSTFKQIGFDRIDHHKRQIYLQPNGDLKVIDVGRTVWRDRVYPYPRKLLTSLGDEHRTVFLCHVQQMAPELYEEWQYYMQLEEVARQAYEQYLSKPTNLQSDGTRKFTSILRTMPNQSIAGDKHIQGLLYKVFKEEWDRVTQNHKAVARDGMPRRAKTSGRQLRTARDERVTVWKSPKLLERLASQEEDLKRQEQSIKLREQKATSESQRRKIREKLYLLREQINTIREQRLTIEQNTITRYKGFKNTERRKDAEVRSKAKYQSRSKRKHPTIHRKPRRQATSK